MRNDVTPDLWFHRALGASGHAIYDQLSAMVVATVADLTQVTGLSGQTIARKLGQMAGLGLVVRSERRSAREPFVWSLIEHPDVEAAADRLGIAGRHDRLADQIALERSIGREQSMERSAAKWQASQPHPALQAVIDAAHRWFVDEDGQDVFVFAPQSPITVIDPGSGALLGTVCPPAGADGIDPTGSSPPIHRLPVPPEPSGEPNTIEPLELSDPLAEPIELHQLSA